MVVQATSNTKEKIIEELKQIIMDTVKISDTRNMDPDSKLFSGGLGFSSIQLIELTVAIENYYNRTFDEELLIEENFDSLSVLSEVIRDNLLETDESDEIVSEMPTIKKEGEYKPTIEDIIAIGGIDTMAPGGFPITHRIGELSHMNEESVVLNVGSAWGYQLIYYAETFGAKKLVGLDIDKNVLNISKEKAAQSSRKDAIEIIWGDAQDIPQEDNKFDIVTSEGCAGIPEDSQKVLDEMVRVAKAGGFVILRECTWMTSLSQEEKHNIVSRFGTVPRGKDEWINMLDKAGAETVEIEIDAWSNPEIFWQVRRDRHVENYKDIYTDKEKIIVGRKIMQHYGQAGVANAAENEKVVYQAMLDRKIGYGIFKAIVRK